MDFKFPLGVLLFLSLGRCLANPEQEAKSLAERLQQKPNLDQPKLLEELRQSNDKKLEAEMKELQSLFEEQGDVGRKAEDPLKASLGKKDLNGRAPQHPGLKEVEALSKQTQRFKFSYQDPLFKRKQEITQAPFTDKTVIPPTKVVSVSSPKERILTCRQTVKPELKSCIKRLILTAIPQPPIIKNETTYVWVQRQRQEGCNCEYGCRHNHFSYYAERIPQQIQVSVPQPPLLKERWEGCEDLERRALEGACEQVEREEQHLNETRSISDYPQPITKPHWSERQAFICGALKELNECEALLKQGCEQIDSKCARLQEGVCVEFENTFKCPTREHAGNQSLTLDLSTQQFVKTKEAAEENFDANDFGMAVTQFNALTELTKLGEDGLGGVSGSDNPKVFHGKCSQCRINLGSFFRDCCKLKGILQGFLGGCNEEEKKLAVAAVKNKRCVRVDGNYCHRKLLKVCVEKRESYCCYGSQLARIIQEIAHQQLGISWGEPKNPNCGSLTAEQLSQLNFDTPYAQAKLAELIPEMQAQAQTKFEAVSKQMAQGKLSERLEALSGFEKSLSVDRDAGQQNLSFKLLHQIQTGQLEPFRQQLESSKLEAETLQLLLHQASKKGVPESAAFIDLLLEYGANPLSKDAEGRNAIDTALLTENRDALRYYKSKKLIPEAELEKLGKEKPSLLEAIK